MIDDHQQQEGTHFPTSGLSPLSKTALDSLQAKRSAASLAYNPLLVDGEQHYKELLERIGSETNRKRQTPLVNAGYAARILAVSHVIRSFLTFHQQKHTAQKIDIYFLGCGFDIMGLWAASLDPGRIRIVEVDMPEICRLKQEQLCQKGLVQNFEPLDDNLQNVIMKGSIANRTISSKSMTRDANYILASVDLREIKSLEWLLSKISHDSLTLAISELVLSYLTPEETDQLLTWCATQLCTFPGSAMLAIEPLGPSASKNGELLSVVSGFRNQYCRQFAVKLERGNSKQTLPESTALHPVGTSCETTSQRFTEMGFEKVFTNTLGCVAAFAVKPNSWECPEMFDEHAALALYLQSYVVICGFSHRTEGFLKRLICPWAFSEEHFHPIFGPGNIGFTVIETMDEIPVRSLFSAIYQNFYEEYPVIRKMVKTALKSDMAISVGDGESGIAARWRAFGGVFVVAIQYDKGTGERRVIGCVALRSSQRRGEEPGTLEIFRLLVDAEHRGKGIGRTMIDLVEQFAQARRSPKVIAVTLNILTEANHLYESCGYKAEDDVPVSNLCLRTYYKRIAN